jgi:hypothetical protein
MRRILLVLLASLLMAAMLAASAMPALAQGPPFIPPGAETAIGAADKHNPVIDVTSVGSVPTCVTLNAPSDNTQIGHHSVFPDTC